MHTPIKVQETRVPNASIKEKEALFGVYVNATLNPCVLEEKVREIEKKRQLFPQSGSVHFCFRFLGSPAAFRAATSPSANHLLALTNCTTLMNCFKPIIGKLMPAITQGTNESILFALANSNAAALCGFKKSDAPG